MAWALAATIAAVLTLFDLDRVFYIPENAKAKCKLRLWWWGFVLVNGACGALTYYFLQDVAPFSGWNQWGSAAVIGFGYLAVLRTKFTTFQFGDKEVPFGIEALYEQAKLFFFKRINRIAMRERYQEALALSDSLSFKELADRARHAFTINAVIDDSSRAQTLSWIDELEQSHQKNPSDYNKLALADALLSGQAANGGPK